MEKILNARVFRVALVCAVLSTVATMPASSGGPVHAHDRLVLILEDGDTVLFVPLGEDPTGSSASLSRVKIGPVGSYVTALQTGSLLPAIFDLLNTGSGSAGPFDGTFSLRNGAIEDEHDAWFTLSPEPPRFAAEFGLPPEAVAVIVVTAEGTITGGTRKYRNASGVTRFFFKVELPYDLSQLPIARGGQFVFEFDD